MTVTVQVAADVDDIIDLLQDLPPLPLGCLHLLGAKSEPGHRRDGPRHWAAAAGLVTPRQLLAGVRLPADGPATALEVARRHDYS